MIAASLSHSASEYSALLGAAQLPGQLHWQAACVASESQELNDSSGPSRLAGQVLADSHSKEIELGAPTWSPGPSQPGTE